jgi:hypothetical protein
MTYVDQEIAKEIFFSIARSKQEEVTNHVLSRKTKASVQFLCTNYQYPNN